MGCDPVSRVPICRMMCSDSEPDRAALEVAFRKTVAATSVVADTAPTIPGVLADLPLWRVQWPVLPGFNQVLHVHVPHYVHSKP